MATYIHGSDWIKYERWEKKWDDKKMNVIDGDEKAMIDAKHEDGIQ